MDYTLIADAGSTKTDWVVLDDTGEKRASFATGGLNALLATEQESLTMLREASSLIPADLLSNPADTLQIYYYGAGCATEQICSKMESSLCEAFSARKALAASDLLGAARSLHGDKSGIACILGTGSNSCLYDGAQILHNVPSLGYVLGDEGSGGALGKRLVSDAFKGHLPESIRDEFLNEYSLTLPEILDRVYRQPAPNKFLASLVPFISSHIWNPYLYSLVRTEFENFLQRNVSPYEGAHTLPIAFTGSIAWHFSDILRQAAENLGFTVGKISDHPLPDLVKYHSSHL